MLLICLCSKKLGMCENSCDYELRNVFLEMFFEQGIQQKKLTLH